MKNLRLYLFPVLLAGLVSGARLADAQTDESASRAIGAMRAAAGVELTVKRSPRTQLATFISAPSGRSIPVPDRSAITPEARALSFVGVYGRAFGLRGREDVQASRTERDSLGFDHVRLRQTRLGIPVTGGEVVLHMRGAAVLSANGKTVADLDDVSLDPIVSSPDAVATARRLVTERLNEPNANLSEPRLEIFNQGLLNGRDFPTRLAWFVEARELALREFIWIDARSGTILLHFSQLADAKNRAVYNGNNGSSLPGTLVRSEGAGPTGDGDVNHAYDFSGDTHDYYLANHGRDSFDGAGGQLISTVHHCPSPAAPGCQYNNAFWNGSQMVYGTGFANADDVVAHELTHAVTERTANLFYYMQSGALNESFSDIFGETVDLSNSAGNDTVGVRWQLGEDIGAIRNMQNPTLFDDPGKMSDSQFKCETSPASGDSGGVHTNSGVPNHAYALMVDGGVYGSVSVTGIGLTKAAKIQYRALTQYLTSASDFLDNYNALQQACMDLIGTAGISAGDCGEVRKALDAVQMANVWPCAPTQATTPALCSAGFVPVNLFVDNFDSGLGNWSMTGAFGVWSRATDPSNVLGGVVYATSGADSLWGYDKDSAGDARIGLASNLPALPANSRLQFNHSFGFDMGATLNYDGGLLEYSTDAGANWTDASALFASGAGYGGAVASGASNPLAGKQAFVRQSYGYTASQYNLSGLAGQSNVRFRFRIGTDNSPGFDDFGWFIDDFRVYQCVPIPTFALAVTKDGTGTGKVTSLPTAIDCGATCSANVAQGGSVTLTAAPSPGSVFTSWGGACSGTGTCSLTMDAAKAVTATFTSQCAPGFDTDTDGIPNTVEAVEGTNPCLMDNDVFTSARLFAMQQYRDFLSREGDAFGIGTWTNSITGGTSRATVTKSFVDSPEFQGAIAPVTRLYFAYFNRIPDKPGLDYWISQYRLGLPLNNISQSFAESPEFVATYGSLNNNAFVTLVYQNVLGRAPDAPGLAHWTAQLDGGFMTRGQVMAGFSESPEYQSLSYSRVFVTMIYYGMLRRVPEQYGFDFWVANINAGVPAVNLINGFLSAPEYHVRFLP